MHASEDITPQFIAAGREYLHLSETLGRHAPGTCAAFSRMYDLAPASFRKEMHDKAVELGLIPPMPQAVDVNGQALYRLEDIAQRFVASPSKKPLQAAREMGVALLEGDADVQPLH